MKKLIVIAVIMVFASCSRYKPEDILGTWICTYNKGKRHKPSEKAIVITFNKGGAMEYQDKGKRVGLSNNWVLSKDKISMHFAGLSNEIDAAYKIKSLENNLMILESEANNTIHLVKAGTNLIDIMESAR